jgi:hypothetical protein
MSFAEGSKVKAIMRRWGVETEYSGTVLETTPGPKGNFIKVDCGEGVVKSFRPANVSAA